MNKLLWMLLSLGLAAPLLGQQTKAVTKPDRGVPADQIPDADPEKQRLTFRLPEGFEVNLFAADPMIAKPVHMNFDARGRLWVASSSIYPQLKPGQSADDKVTILEDADGDGKAEKSTVFAQGLLIPTGIEAGDGGCYIANSTELLHLRDTDGDDKADETRVVLSGFGTEDTHHLIHTLRWGVDGRLYFNQSIYIHSHVETPWGPRRLLGGGIWRFEPRSMRLDIFARGFINPWGHIFDSYGQSFATDGAYGEGINYVFPGATFVQAVGAKRILHGLNPGQPKHCGLEIVSGRHFPEAWQGNLITCDFRGHKVNRFAISEDGSGYASRQREDLIVSDHVAFRPIDVKMGPDGALYIADWYNPIINHGEVDFRDPRRDRTHGRIWRVTYKGKPTLKTPRIAGAPVEQLLESLKAPEGWTREKARRELRERGGAAVKPALASWTKAQAQESHRLEALWVYQALDVLAEDLLRQLLGAADHRVRAAAVRVLADFQAQLGDSGELLKRAVEDDHPRVRLEAVNALGLRPSAESARIAALALDRPMDVNLDFALWLTMRELAAEWAPAAQKQPELFTSPRHLVFAAKAAESPEAVGALVALYTAGKVSGADEQGALEVIATYGGAQELNMVLTTALEPSTSAGRRSVLLNALIGAARSGRKPTAGPERVAELLDSPDEAVKAAAARLAGLWQVEGARSKLVEIAEGQASGDGLRRAAVDGLVSLGGQQTQTALSVMTQADRPVALRLMAAAGLAALNMKLGARAAVDVMSDVPAGTDVSVVFDAFLTRKGGPAALAAALLEQKLPADVAALGLRKLSTSGQKSPELEKRLLEAGGSPQTPMQLTGEEMARLMAEVRSRGDAARGEVIYRRTSLLCAQCHAVGGAGGQVGPDLSSLGASAPLEYIIESLIEPSRKIKEGYNASIVTRIDGTVTMGVQGRKTDTELLMRDAADHELVIPLAQVSSMTPNPISLMPPGLTAQLRRDEFVDLVRYLSELGRGAFAVGKERVVRRWRVLDAGQELEDLIRQSSTAMAATDDPRLTYRPAYSGVNGELPLDEVPQVRRFFGRIFGFARFHLDVSAAGPAMLRFNDAKGLQMWVGTERIDVEPQTKLNLPRGTVTVTLSIDRQERQSPLRVELADLPGTGTQVKIVMGK